MRTNTAVDLKTHEEKLRKISLAYDSPTWWYDIRGFFILTFCYNDTLWSQIRFFARNFSAAHLEGAIGTGTLAQMCLLWRRIFYRKTPKATGVAFDYAPSMLEGAKTKFRKHGAWEVLVADITRLPFASGHFETANVANAFHCFPEPNLAMRELHRVLRPNGTLAVNVIHWPQSKSIPARLSRRIMEWGIRKGILYSPYTPEFIRELAQKAGFVIVEETKHRNNTYWLFRKPV